MKARANKTHNRGARNVVNEVIGDRAKQRALDGSHSTRADDQGVRGEFGTLAGDLRNKSRLAASILINKTPI